MFHFSLGVKRVGFICGFFFFQAFEAIQQILRISKNKRIDVVLLDRVMTELENRNSACKSPSSSIESEASSNESTETKPCAATPAETQRYLELLGKIIQQVSKFQQLPSLYCLILCDNSWQMHLI